MKRLIFFTAVIYSTLASSTELETNNSNANSLLPYYFSAARIGDNEVIKTFVEAGLPVDITNEKGYTALMIATYNGQHAAVKQLLAFNANACAEDKRGNTALMAAIFKGELAIGKTLLTADCNENHQNNTGQTPLMYASLFGREKIQQLLIERGADIDLRDHAGNSASSIELFNQQGY